MRLSTLTDTILRLFISRGQAHTPSAPLVPMHPGGHEAPPPKPPSAFDPLPMGALQAEGSWLIDTDTLHGLAPILPHLPGRYESVQLVGEGASSRVFKAFDSQLQRWVALKIPRRRLQGDLLAEARAQANVEHPNVCRIYALESEEGRTFIAMQLVEGPALSAVSRHLAKEEILQLVRDVAEGVHAAHERGLVHLDLKPGNILLQSLRDGSFQPLITDFGMVRTECQPGLDPCPLGTPPYSSPEQLRGDSALVDRRSDVHALGVLLYVLLTAEFPFKGDNQAALATAVQNQLPIPIRRRRRDLSPDLEAVIAK